MFHLLHPHPTKSQPMIAFKEEIQKEKVEWAVLCSVCSNYFLSKQQRDQHLAEDHTDITPLELYMEYIPSYVSEDPNLKKCIEDNIHLIMTPHLNHTASKKLNYYKFYL